MIDYLALAGDSSDNIPGIRGVGEKTAADLLSKYGDVEGILANVASIKGKLGEKVAAGRDDATISKFLTTIRTDVPIEPDWNAYKLDGVDRDKLAAVCAKFELNRLARDLLGDGAAAEAEPAKVLARSRLHDPRSPFLIGNYQEGDRVHDVPQASWIDGQTAKFMSATHMGIASKPSFGPSGAPGVPIASTASASCPRRSGIVSKSYFILRLPDKGPAAMDRP